MTSWMGWVAAQPSRLTWDEWRQRGQQAATEPPVTTPVDNQPALAVIPDVRIAALEQRCGQLTVENAGLRTALAHWQRQPVAVGA